MDDAATAPAVRQPAEAAATPLRVLAELGGMLQVDDDNSLRQVLQRVAVAAWSVVPELTEVSVTLVEAGRPTTAAFAGSLASFLDAQQHEQSSGPCLDAAVTGTTITLDTADPGSAYPEFARTAAALGITQVLAVGLPIAHRTVGSLNLYSVSLRPLAESSVALAETFAGYAAVAVANASRHGSVEEAAHMRQAIRTRSVIEQARGILMVTRGGTAEEAIALLAQVSRQQHRALPDVAADVVERVRSGRPPL